MVNIVHQSTIQIETVVVLFVGTMLISEISSARWQLTK